MGLITDRRGRRRQLIYTTVNAMNNAEDPLRILSLVCSSVKEFNEKCFGLMGLGCRCVCPYDHHVLASRSSFA